MRLILTQHCPEITCVSYTGAYDKLTLIMTFTFSYNSYIRLLTTSPHLQMDIAWKCYVMLIWLVSHIMYFILAYDIVAVIKFMFHNIHSHIDYIEALELCPYGQHLHVYCQYLPGRPEWVHHGPVYTNIFTMAMYERLDFFHEASSICNKWRHVMYLSHQISE